MNSTAKRRAPDWNGETMNGRPLLRGILIAPSKWQLRVGEGHIICIGCPFCGKTHTHGWPGGPERTTPEHKAAHCRNGGVDSYYVAPVAVEVVL